MPPQNSSTNARSGGHDTSLRRRISASSNPVYDRPRAPPLAVQSMLRTTTEMGDIMSLTHVKESKTRSGSRLQSTRPRSDSFDSSFASALQHSRSPRYRPPHRRQDIYKAASGPRLSRHDTIQSNLSSYNRMPRDRLPEYRLRPVLHQGYMSSGKPPKSIYRHRSILSLRNHREIASRYSGSSIRSTNPSLLSHRSRNLETVHDSNKRYKRVGHTFDRNHTSVVSFPRMAGGHTKNHNFPAIGSRSAFTSASGPVSIAGVPSMDLATRLASNGWRTGTSSAPPSMSGAWNTPLTNRESMNLNSARRQPRYYDYSESFLEEYDSMPESPIDFRSHFVRTRIAKTGPTNDVERVQPADDSLLGTHVLPAELPAEHYFRPDGSLKHDTGREQRSHGYNVQNLYRCGLPELPTDKCENRSRGERAGIPEPFELEANERRFSGASRRTCASSKPGIFFLKGEKSQRDLPLLVARVHSPDPESSFETNQTENSTYPFALDSHHQIGYHSKTNIRSAHVLAILVSGRPRTSPLEMCRGDLEVISPQPERPISSQSLRQFKKIIDIDEDIRCSNDAMPGDALMRPRCSVPSIIGVGQLVGRIPSEVVWNDVISMQESPLDQIMVLDGVRTPDQSIEPSMVLSHGKSTVDILLESHIRSLGLMPETDTSSESSGMQTDCLKCTNHDEAILIPSKDRPSNFIETQLQTPSASRSKTSSLSSRTRMKMKPRRLFASQDGKITAFPEPLIYSFKAETHSTQGRNGIGHLSFGWQTLPSNSQTSAHHTSSKPTLMSGEIADNDTDVYPLGCRVWRLSQLSLPTTEEEHSMLSPIVQSKENELRRSRSENSAIQMSQNRRRLRVHVKPLAQRDFLSKTPSATQINGSDTIHALGNSTRLLQNAQNSELNDDKVSACIRDSLEGQNGVNNLMIPNRWSGIIAAMPMPGTGKPILPRKVSTRTHASYRSGRSQASLAERLNSTRQKSYIPRLGSIVPRLAPPDLGPPLDTSTLDLSVPYAEVPSTILLSKRDTPSLFDDNPPSRRNSQRAKKRQFGLRPLQGRTQCSKRMPMAANIGLPTRNGLPIPPVTSFSPGSLSGYHIHNVAYQGTETAYMPDLTCPRKGALGRIKDWWRKQCLHRALAARRDQMMRQGPEKQSQWKE